LPPLTNNLCVVRGGSVTGMRQALPDSLTPEKVVAVVAQADNFRDLTAKLGLSDNKRKMVTKLVRDLELDTGHFNCKPASSCIGEQYGMLTVESVEQHNGRSHCRCRCECGNEVLRRTDGLKSGKFVSCGCVSKTRNYTGSGNPCWRGSGDIGMTFYKNLRRGAFRRGIDFNVSLEYLASLFDEQGGRCALTGETIGFGKLRVSVSTTASLDRIDSLRPYEEGNVQWVHKDINILKGSYDQDRFIQLCELVTDHTRSQEHHSQ
jgi:hypothetical protein